MKYKELIDKVTEELKNPETGIKMLTYNLFGSDRPLIHWSYTNQFIAFMYGFKDARSFMAWKRIGREVKRGERAFYIIKPYVFEDKKTGEQVLRFGTQPEFGYEQTEGDPLPIDADIEKVILKPDMIKVAESIGVKVEKGMDRHGEAGYYNHSKKLIMITSDDDTVLYHELAHAVDYHLTNPALMSDKEEKEIVAEYCSAILARHFDKNSSVSVSKGYMERFVGKTLVNKMDKVFSRVTKIINFILEEKDV